MPIVLSEAWFSRKVDSPHLVGSQLKTDQNEETLTALVNQSQSRLVAGLKQCSRIKYKSTSLRKKKINSKKEVYSQDG